MPNNVEIKARLSSEQFDRTKQLASELSDQPLTILHQVDTFFHVQSGRLKLREFLDPATGAFSAPTELIQYERPDQPRPKLSSYRRIIVEDSVEDSELKPALIDSLGVLGVVEKQRQLLFFGQTRVHLDSVVDLGSFLELEVVLQDDQTFEYGREIAEQIMHNLGIDHSQLISRAYIDLLLGA